MAENQGVKDRLLGYLEFKNIRKSHFEKTCGLCNGYVNSIVNSISPHRIRVISENYPDLNTGWLLTGDGEMLRPIDATSDSVGEANVKESEAYRKLAQELESIMAERDELVKKLEARELTIDALTASVNALTERARKNGEQWRDYTDDADK